MNDELIKSYLDEVKKIADSISFADVKKATEIIYDTKVQGGMVYICGNGGSASNASHFACDLLNLGCSVLCLNDNPAVITGTTNDDGFGELYIKQMMKRATKYDVLICLSVHGGNGQDKAGAWSQNLVKAINYMNTQGGKSIGLVGYDGGMVKKLATITILAGNSTPQAESWQVHIEHLICELLKERAKK
jgi:D-sedoheptulose 7-phosphate isomerase